MRKFIVFFIVAICLLIAGLLYSNLCIAYEYDSGVTKADVIKIIEKFLTRPQETKVFRCPRSKISDQDQCLKCHTMPSFKLREKNPSEGYDFPTNTEILFRDKDQKIGHYKMRTIDCDTFRNSIRYLYHQHGIKHIIVDIRSPGGSLFEGWEIQGLISEYEKMGVVFETRCYSFAASAAFIVLVSGTKGHRVINSQAELMFHELWTFKMFDISTPADKEDEAKVLRHIMDGATTWLASKCSLTAEEIKEKIRKKEWWMNGMEAMEYGFVDGFLD